MAFFEEEIKEGKTKIMDSARYREIILAMQKWLDNGIAARSKANDTYGKIELGVLQNVKTELEHLKMKYA